MRRGVGVAALAAVGVLAAGQRGLAAVAIDSVLQASVFDQPELESPNLTIGSGPKRLLVVGLTVGNPAVEVDKVTWNGTALLRHEGRMLVGPGGFCHLELWTLIEPAPGNNLLFVSLSAPAAFGLGAVAYTGVDASSPLGPTAWASAIGGEVAVDVPAPGDRPVLAAACLGGPWVKGPNEATPMAMPGVEETSLWNFTEPGIVGLGSHRLAKDGLGRARWAITTVDPFSWLAVAVSIKPDGEILPDAGPDAAREDARTAADLADGQGGTFDAAASDKPASSDGLPPVSDVPDAASMVDVRLRVGCACRIGDTGGGWGAVIVMALALLAIGQRRRLS